MSQAANIKQSQVKRSDEKLLPGRKWDSWLFSISIIFLLASLVLLFIARSLAAERTHVPFSGVLVDRPITSGASTMAVSNIQHKSGSGRFTAPSGYEYLVLTLSIRNNGEKPFDVFPMTDTYIKSASGKISYVTAYDLVNPFHSGSILPGESTMGELSYLIPKNASYKYYIEASWSGGAIPFMVQ